MNRYRPRSEYWDGEPTTAREFHQADRDGFTGLYDHTGTPLYREPEPFGFQPNRHDMKKAAPKKKKGKGC